MQPIDEFLQHISRRGFLGRSGLCLGAMARGSLLNEDRAAAESAASGDPLAPHAGHFAPRAKHVIYLHMIGAPSQLDLFDYKPELVARDGQPCPEELTRGKRFAFLGDDLKLGGSSFKFARHGQSGQELSVLLPHLATVADEIT